jgi:hypothetical protein
MKFRFVFWDVLPCIIIVDQRFRGTCCLHDPRRQIWTSYSPPWELEISHYSGWPATQPYSNRVPPCRKSVSVHAATPACTVQKLYKNVAMMMRSSLRCSCILHMRKIPNTTGSKTLVIFRSKIKPGNSVDAAVCYSNECVWWNVR